MVNIHNNKCTNTFLLALGGKGVRISNYIKFIYIGLYVKVSDPTSKDVEEVTL